MRPECLDPLVVGPVRTEQRLDRESAGHVGRLDQQLRLMHREGQQRLHRLGTVHQRQALFGRQLKRGQAVFGQYFGGWPAVAPVASGPQPPGADQRLSQVRELRQVS